MNFEFMAMQYKFGALLAFGFLIVYFCSMYLGGVIGSVVYYFLYATETASNVATSTDEARVILVVLKRLGGMLLGGCVLYFLIRQIVQRMPNAVSYSELGFVRSSWVICIALFALGLSLNLFFVLVARQLFPFAGARSPHELEGINEVAERFTYMAAFCLIVLAPLNEEALFRGALYSGFKNSFGKIPASLVITLIFSSTHLDAYSDGYWVNIVSLLLCSLLLVLIRTWSGSLYPAMSVHAGLNSVLLFPVQIFSG